MMMFVKLNDVSVKYKYFFTKIILFMCLKYLPIQDCKLLLYKNFKKSNLMEKYLTVHNFEHRKAVTKLRVSEHHLPIEIGREKIWNGKSKLAHNVLGISLGMNAIFCLNVTILISYNYVFNS